jgi:hypothetical protein
MSRELQELRSLKEGERQGSVTDRTAGSSSSLEHPPTEEVEDDLEIHSAIISLGDVFLEPAAVTEIFKM